MVDYSSVVDESESFILLNQLSHTFNGSITVNFLYPSPLIVPQATSASVSLIASMASIVLNGSLESTSSTALPMANHLMSGSLSALSPSEEVLNETFVKQIIAASSTSSVDVNVVGTTSNVSSSGSMVDGASSASGSEYGNSNRVPLSIEILMYIMYTSVIIAALGGNGVVCFLILAYQKMRTVTNFFILNLAIGDILMACLCVPFTFVSNLLLQSWPFGSVMCVVVSYSQAVSVFVSAYTLVAISIDRYIAILYPLRPRMTKFQAKLIIACIWLVSLLTPLPTALLSKVIQPDSDRNVCMETWDADQRYYYSWLLMILQYIFPLSVLIFTYTRIALVVWGKQTPGEAEDGRDQRLAASKRKMVKMMITCVTVFTLCWLPLNALQVIGDQYPDIYTFSYILYIWFACHFLAMSHACYNPVIYIWMNSRFRSGFKYIVSQMVPCLYRDEAVTPPDFLPHNVTTHTGHFNLHHSSNPIPPTHPSGGHHQQHHHHHHHRSNSYKSSSLVSLKRTHQNNNDHHNNRDSGNVVDQVTHLPTTATTKMNINSGTSNQSSIVTTGNCNLQMQFEELEVKKEKNHQQDEQSTTCTTISVNSRLANDVCINKSLQNTKDQTQVHLLINSTTQSAKEKADPLDTSSSQLEKELEYSPLNHPMASLNINSTRLKSPPSAANEYKRCHRQSYPSIKSEKDRGKTKPLAQYFSLKEAVTVTQSALDSDSDEKTNDATGQTERQTDLQAQQHSITNTTLTTAADAALFSPSLLTSSSSPPTHPHPHPHSPPPSSSSSQCDKVHPILSPHSLQLSPPDSIVKDRQSQSECLSQCICANETTFTKSDSRKASSQQNSSLQSTSQSPSSPLSSSSSSSSSSSLSPSPLHHHLHLHPTPVNCSDLLPGQSLDTNPNYV